MGHWRPPYRDVNGRESGEIRSATVFVGHNEKHAHAIESQSFINKQDIVEIIKMLKTMLILGEKATRDDHRVNNSSNFRLKTSDIGIICAFRAQVLLMRKELRAQNMGNISVGSPEDFQGQEKRVILISTVLSGSIPKMLQGVHNSLGILNQERKGNVCLTRAQALTVVVGNPELLLRDSLWRNYIRVCKEKDGYFGAYCPLIPEDIEKRLDNETDEEAVESQLRELYPRDVLLGQGHTELAETERGRRTDTYEAHETKVRLI